MGTARAELHGLLLIDKPGGTTSARVVAAVRKRLGGVKVGHTGTLDPMATGLLPLVVGDATRIAAFLLAEDKGYSGTLELGVETDSHDAEGQVVAEHRAAAGRVTRAELEAAMSPLRGSIEQVPPMVSALRRDGRRLHELARAGQTVERAPRSIHVHRFEVTRFSPPRADFVVECSKGTYVRALARDVGRALGVGAHLSALRRLTVGRWRVDDAMPPDEVDGERARARLISLADALAHLPAVHPEPEHLRRIAQGLPRRAGELVPWLKEDDLFRCLTPDGRLLAVAAVRGPEVRYERVFPGALAS